MRFGETRQLLDGRARRHDLQVFAGQDGLAQRQLIRQEGPLPFQVRARAVRVQDAEHLCALVSPRPERDAHDSAGVVVEDVPKGALPLSGELLGKELDDGVVRGVVSGDGEGRFRLQFADRGVCVVDDDGTHRDGLPPAARGQAESGFAVDEDSHRHHKDCFAREELQGSTAGDADSGRN